MVDDTKARQNAQDMKETVRDEARRTGETVKNEAQAVADQATEVGRAHAEQRFDQGKGAIEEQVETIHSAVDGAARRLHEENSPLASYADELSGQLARFSDNIENSSLDDLAVKTRRVARENPGLFVLGSVVAGIAAGRFFKASSSRSHDDHDDYDRDDAYRAGSDDYRAGREAAMGRYRAEYGTSATYGRTPYRPGAELETQGRVPMDSSLAAGASTTNGATPTTAATASTAGSAKATVGTDNKTGDQ